MLSVHFAQFPNLCQEVGTLKSTCKILEEDPDFLKLFDAEQLFFLLVEKFGDETSLVNSICLFAYRKYSFLTFCSQNVCKSQAITDWMLQGIKEKLSNCATGYNIYKKAFGKQ